MATLLRSGEKLVIASHNTGKVREIGALLEPFGLSVVSAGELDIPEPEETGDTFEANAELKAVASAIASDLPSLADDSGLVVEALGGAPGIYSARWAGPNKDFAKAMAEVEDKLKALGATEPADRRATFVAVLCLAFPNGATTFYRGEVHGVLVYPPRGANGFGYDPVFVPDGESQTFGELPADVKAAMSHRARAFEFFKREALEQ